MKGDKDMSDRDDFNMYSKFNDKKPLRKNNLRANKEEFGAEENFAKKSSKNKESFSDWVAENDEGTWKLI